VLLRSWERESYQFAAMMAFPSGLTRLLFGLCFTFGMLERFFFFWSSRPILMAWDGGGVGGGDMRSSRWGG